VQSVLCRTAPSSPQVLNAINSQNLNSRY